MIVYSRSQPEAFLPYKAAEFDKAMGDVGPFGKINHPNFTAIDATPTKDKTKLAVKDHGNIYSSEMIDLLIKNLRRFP